MTETTGGLTTYYGYDHRGNQTVKQAPEGTTYFQYNHQNLLTRIDLPDATSNEFGYDGDSKRVWVNDSQGARRMIYQGPDMLKLFQEKDVVGQTVAQYTMGLGLESMRRGEASSFYHYDALGSTQELTNGGEVVTDTYRYNAWGETLAQTGATANPHRYVGRKRYYGAVPSGLYHLGFRYYDAPRGHFTSVDPILFPLALGTGGSRRLGRDAGSLAVQWDASPGLYFTQAKYYQANVPRFISRDPLQGQVEDPESIYRYLYVADSPVNLLDPLGLLHLEFDGWWLWVGTDPGDPGYPNVWQFPAFTGSPLNPRHPPILPGSYCLKPSIHYFGAAANLRHSSYGGWSWPIVGAPGYYIHGGPWRPTWGCIRVQEPGEPSLIQALPPTTTPMPFHEWIQTMFSPSQGCIPLHVHYRFGGSVREEVPDTDWLDRLLEGLESTIPTEDRLRRMYFGF